MNDYGSKKRKRPVAGMRSEGMLPKGPTRGAAPVGTKEVAGKAMDMLKKKANMLKPKFLR